MQNLKELAHENNGRGNVSANAPLGPRIRVAHGFQFANQQLNYKMNPISGEPNGRKSFVLQTPYAVTLPQSSESVPKPFYSDEMWKKNLPRNSRVNAGWKWNAPPCQMCAKHQ